MQISFQCRGETLIARLQGELDILVTDDCRQRIDKELERRRPRFFILDLGETSFMDSSGLAVILGRYQRINRWGGRMALIRARPAVQRMLQLAGVERLALICDSELEALNQMAAVGNA